MKRQANWKNKQQQQLEMIKTNSKNKQLFAIIIKMQTICCDSVERLFFFCSYCRSIEYWRFVW